MSVLTNYLFSASLNMLWAILNSLQLIIHLPLFSFQFPSNAYSFFSQVISIATFDLIETKGWIHTMFSLDEYEGSYTQQFEFLDYLYLNFVANSSFIFIVMIITALLVLTTAMLRLCNRKRKVRHIRRFLSSKLYWKVLIQLLLEFSLEFFIISFIDIK